MELLYLDESQAAAFDIEFHSSAEMKKKLERMDRMTSDRPLQILDIGGGNGRFVDSLLTHFPDAQATVLDISSTLLEANKPHPRKTLVMASVDTLPAGLNGQTFDVITLNWLLHHLVGSTYAQCTSNCLTLLENCRPLLKPGGAVIVAENRFNGFAGSNIPSWVIYLITRIKAPWFVAIARRYFNTAGVGVCFRSQSAWRSLFRKAGFVIQEDDGEIWRLSRKTHFLMAFLGIHDVSHGHYYLLPE